MAELNSVDQLSTLIDPSSSGTREAYESIKEILNKQNINIATSSGLRQVIYKDKVVWLLDDDAVEVDYKATVDK